MSMIWLTSSSANSSALSFLVLYFLHFWRVILPKIQMNALTHGVFKHKLSRCAVRQNFDSIIITTTITSITIIIIIITIITCITIITITITTIIFITTIAKAIIINKPSIPVISLMYFSSLRSFAAIERQSSKSFK